MSTEDISIVIQILSGITSPDNALRTTSTNKLLSLKQNLGALSFCLLQISSLPQSSSSDPIIKTTALVILRKILDLGTLREWSEIPQSLKSQIKLKSLELFMKETNMSQKRKIKDIIVEIVDKVIDCEEEWDDLKKISCDIFEVSIIHNESNSNTIESILLLIKETIGFLFDDLYQINTKVTNFLLEIFKWNNMRLKMIASELICEFISFGNRDEIKIFQQFIFYILQSMLESLNSGNEECLKKEIQTIIEISSLEKKMITPHFNDLFILAQKIIEKKDYNDDKIRELSFEMIVNFIEEKPSVIERHKDKMKTLYECLYKYALEFDREIEALWSTPNGNNYEDIEPIEEEKIKCSQGMIDRLNETFDIENSSPILTELINGLVMHSDWGYKYIGLFSLGNFTENEEDMSSIEMAFPVVFNLISHEHQKVRFAAIHCINQLCTSYNPQFQQKYISQIIPLLLNAFEKENILRLQCEIIETLTSFIEFTTCDNLMPNVHKLYEVLFGAFMQNIPIMLRKSVLECILEISTVIEDQCIPFASKAFDILIKSYSDNYQRKTNKILYGSLLGCITTIGPYIKDAYYPVIPDILNSMIDLVKGISFNNDPIRKDLEISLEKLVPILQDNFKHLLPNIIQTVLSLIAIRPKMSVSSLPLNEQNIEDILDEKNNKKIELKTSETEDLEGSLTLLYSIIESLDEEFVPYIDIVEKQVFPLITFQFNPKIRRKVSKFLPQLIEICPYEQKAQKGKMYISILLNAIEKEIDFRVTQKMFTNLKDVIDYSNIILAKNELNSFFNKLLVFFENVEKKRQKMLSVKSSNSIKEKTKNKKSTDIDTDDEDTKEELIEEDIAQIEDVQSSISDTIGILFKTHKDICDDIISVITSKILPKYSSNSSSSFESKLALFIADDMIEFLGQEKLSAIWENLYNLLTSLAGNADDGVRQAACYGIGIFAQYTNENFDKYAPGVIKALYNAMRFEMKSKEDEREWGVANDNIIAALGKILFYKGTSEFVKKSISEIVEIWVSNMPIKYDVSEQEKQHEWLVDMMILKREMIPIKCMHCAFKAVARIYKTKMSNEIINQKIEQIFQNAKNNEEMSKIVNEVYNMEENKIKKKIEKLLN